MILKKSLPVMRYGAKKFKNFISISSKMVKDRVMKVSGIIDLSIGVADRGLSILAVTSNPDRKWKKKSKFSKPISNQNLYHIIRSVFKC
jgi:hypothetical protein